MEDRSTELVRNSKRFCLSALAASCAEAFTFPVDSVKTRMQLAGEHSPKECRIPFLSHNSRCHQETVFSVGRQEAKRELRSTRFDGNYPDHLSTRRRSRILYRCVGHQCRISLVNLESRIATFDYILSRRSYVVVYLCFG